MRSSWLSTIFKAVLRRLARWIRSPIARNIAEQARFCVAYLRTKFRRGRVQRFYHPYPNPDHRQLCYASRHRDSPVTYIYDRLIPYLIRIGEAKLLAKEGKKETYAFRVEN
jgi:hypothetical protein